jgi:hypothetical protein
MMTKSKLATVAALALLAGGAQAAMTNAAAPGNSSLVFIAIDTNSNAGFIADLGLSMSDFTNVASTALPQGTWDFAANSSTFASVTGQSWSAAYNTFKAAQSGGDLTWGVIAADQPTGTTTSASNTILGRGVLATGTPTVANMTAIVNGTALGNGIGNFNTFVAAASNRGNIASADNGAAATSSSDGSAWLPNSIGSAFTTSAVGNITWSYMSANGATSNFQWVQQLASNPVVVQFGHTNATDSLAANPLTFTFDVDTNKLVLAVPEPGTYAMLLAGIAALGFVARRRQA